MAFSLVTSSSAGSSNNNDVTTSAVNTTGSTLIVISIAVGNVTPTTPSDNQGNTYTQAVATGVSVRNTAIFYCKNPTTNSSHTFTYSQSSSFPSIYVMAFSGDVNTVGSTNNNSGVASTIQPGSVTPSGDNELFVSSVATNGATTYSINSSFTIQEKIESSGANYKNGAISYKIQTTGSSENPTWTFGTSIANACVMCVFSINGGSSVNSNFLQFFI